MYWSWMGTGVYMSPDMVVEDGDVWNVTWPTECVFPDSCIIGSFSGDWKLAVDVREGDSALYYDYELERVEVGKINHVYIHKKATNFVRYEFDDGSYLEATDYHPIYTENGWKSLTQRNGYEVPNIGDNVKTQNGWKKLTNIEEFTGLEDCYDFSIVTPEGNLVNNYFANGTLVQGSY